MNRISKMTTEFILIVVGILVALAIDNAVGKRNDDRMRAVYLSRIQEAIVADKQLIRDNIEFFTGVRKFCQVFLEWLESDQAVDKEILLTSYWAAEIWPFEPDMSTYQDLKSTGNFRLFEDIDFRRNLAEYYIKAEAAAPFIEVSKDYRKIIRGIIPNDIQAHIGNHCSTTDDMDKAPTGFPTCPLEGVDYEELTRLYEPLKHDEHFKRLLVYRISEIRTKNYLLQIQSRYADDVLRHFDNL